MPEFVRAGEPVPVNRSQSLWCHDDDRRVERVCRERADPAERVVGHRDGGDYDAAALHPSSEVRDRTASDVPVVAKECSGCLG